MRSLFIEKKSVVIDVHLYKFLTCLAIMQMYSGITRGRLLNGVLYAQRFQKLIYLHLSK